ncbi:MAG: DNA polymerase III subunit alpha [Alphaproteobacteria bacterium]|nr:DNA polymerase III subunit alpha [Alphaproteobacteria bacterium]
MNISPDYAELATLSNFSFLKGGSHPHELILRAAELGHTAIALCDHNCLAGVVRAYSGAKQVHDNLKKDEKPIRFITGARLVFADNTPDILVYPGDRAAYGRLCALLTKGNRRTIKGRCELRFADLAGHAKGQLFALMADEADWASTERALSALAQMAPGRVWLAAACRYDGADRARLNRLSAMAKRVRVPMLAVNDVIYHDPARRPLQDAITCIREHKTIATAGRLLAKNAERHLKSPTEMARLFREHPDALAQTIALTARIDFTLDDLRYNYPLETVGENETAHQTLCRLTWQGATKRYPNAIPYKVKRAVVRELKLIEQKQYAAYFLTVHDLVRFARKERGILCQGRGSAANSAVCFCLGVTEVDPMVGNLVFGRFLSTERDEPPDIDIDFEHERREEVIQYLYAKYTRQRAALTATVITYRSRSAVREMGKVFALSEDMITAMNGLSWGSNSKGVNVERLGELGLNAADPTLAMVIKLVGQLVGFPRHLSQHSGGFVLTGDRLDHCIPISNAAMDGRTVVEWDKNDLDALGILKVDVLALGMLSCIRRAFDLMHTHYGRSLDLASVMRDQNPRVYAMIERADTLGVFQIESRAQMSMLPRLKPANFYDLVIEVAIVRPGPIQGGMVHPYLKRRQGLETPEKVGPALHKVLERTLGIPLFQEQAMQIAIVAGGFTPGEADRLRRAMATFRNQGTIGKFRDRMVSGMLERGYERDFAERCFKQIEGFADYGFPESHAASFALLVYVSCWLKCFYPDVFACALLNSQPMGFYAPAQIVRDAREHGIDVRGVDINLSDVEAVLEERFQDKWTLVIRPARPARGQKRADPARGQKTQLDENPAPAAEHIWPRHAEMKNDIKSVCAIRLGLTKIKGFSRHEAELLQARRGGGYDSVRDLWLRTKLPVASLERLAEADGFRSLGLDRRAALWAVRGLKGAHGAELLPLFAAAGRPDAEANEQEAALPPMALGEHVVHDYRTLSLSLKCHPLEFLRDKLEQRGCVSANDLMSVKDGTWVEIAGLVLVRQRPGTASGVIFASLEDETGVANVIVWPKVFETFRRVVLSARLMGVKGRVQREGLVIHVIARQVFDLTPELATLSGDTTPAKNPLKHPPVPARHPRNVKVWPGGRNFH